MGVTLSIYIIMKIITVQKVHTLSTTNPNKEWKIANIIPKRWVYEWGYHMTTNICYDEAIVETQETKGTHQR